MTTFTFTRTLKESDLVALCQTEFRNKVRRLYEEFEKTITSPVFYFTGPTKRKNGEIVTGQRNAFDTGELLESQSLKYVSPKLAMIFWQAPYTTKIFDAATVDLVKFTLERAKL